jgi:hypothetical protein
MMPSVVERIDVIADTELAMVGREPSYGMLLQQEEASE